MATGEQQWQWVNNSGNGLTTVATVEGVWDHLELGLGLGWECDGLTWYDDEKV